LDIFNVAIDLQTPKRPSPAIRGNMQGWTNASVIRGSRCYHLYWICKDYFSNLLLILITSCHSIIVVVMYSKYMMIQKDGLNRAVNGASTHARHLVAVFQVLCSLYGLTCVGYVQNSLEFFSRSPLIHVKILVLHSSHFVLN